MQNEDSPRGLAPDLARECLYRFLAAVSGGPYASGWHQARDPVAQDIALAAADWIDSGTATESTLDSRDVTDPMTPEVACLVDGLRAPLDELRADYDRIFGLVVPKDCPPYETEYYPTQETFARSQQMADIAGFYRAFGIEPARSSPERPDHLALELEFMAFLLLKKREALAAADSDPEAAERAQICDQAQRDFFRDHLAWWVPTFAAGLRHKARGGYHGALAAALAAWVPDECRRLGIESVLRPAGPELIEKPDEQSGCAACHMLT
jgi:TorA maturation chaperone TorD